MDELEELRRWKKEQMQVESEWDAQAVGRELDLPLGSSIRAGILPAVKKLRQQLATMYSLVGVEAILVAALTEYSIGNRIAQNALADAQKLRAEIVAKADGYE